MRKVEKKLQKWEKIIKSLNVGQKEFKRVGEVGIWDLRDCKRGGKNLRFRGIFFAIETFKQR